jgi:hypothetical protein
MNGYTVLTECGQFSRFVECGAEELSTLLLPGERVQTQAEMATAIARALRAERDRLLQACDWTQLPDAPSGTREAWATYRQALRDVTDQPGFPHAINWPTPPA